MDDLFDSLRPPEPVEVPVGRKRVLQIHPLTLAQYVQLSKFIKGIENLPDLVVPVLQALDAEGAKDKSMWQLIREQIPAFWKGAKSVLFTEFPQVLNDVSRLVLLTPENSALLELQDKDQQDPRTHVWTGNPKLAEILAKEITPAQAVNILAQTIKMLQVGDMVGKALTLVTAPETLLETAEEPSEDESPAS